MAMMANLNPAELAALEKEVGGLVAAMSAAEAKKAAMEMQVGTLFVAGCCVSGVWGQGVYLGCVSGVWRQGAHDAHDDCNDGQPQPC
jgi:hypothetical protein